MKTFLMKAVLAATLVGFSSALAFAAQQTHGGKLLLVKNPKAGDTTKRKIVYKVKEVASTNTVVGDPTAHGAKLKITLNSNWDCYELPASGWSGISTLGFNYKDPKGAYGPVAVASIKKTPSGNFMIKAKISGKNGPVSVIPPNPGTAGHTNLSLGTGDEYCTTFGGTIAPNNAKLFKAKNAPAPQGCTVNACSPSGAFLSITSSVMD